VAAVGGTSPEDDVAAAALLSRSLGRAVVVKKGFVDAIASALARPQSAPGGAGEGAGEGGGGGSGSGGAEPPLDFVSTTVGLGGSNRRCGGQGDVLAGTLGTFLAWASKSKLLPSASQAAAAAEYATLAPHAAHTHASAATAQLPSLEQVLVAAAAGAASVTRNAAMRAFQSKRRATTTADIIDFVGEGFELAFVRGRGERARVRGAGRGRGRGCSHVRRVSRALHPRIPAPPRLTSARNPTRLDSLAAG
jgi:hypothetical protein